MEQMIFELVYRALREHAESLSDAMLSGNLKSYEAYKAHAAQYEMCKTIEYEVKEIERRVSEM